MDFSKLPFDLHIALVPGHINTHAEKQVIKYIYVIKTFIYWVSKTGFFSV